MAEENFQIIRARIRSPRSAAFAGIFFSILMVLGMALTARMTSSVPADIDRTWLERWSSTATVVVAIVPFAGLAFLWFTGVVRDRLGDREDRFFETVFLGSGIIFIGMLFVWGGTIGAIFGTYTAAVDQVVDDDVFIFGFALMNEIIGNYALRMIGVYMFSIGGIWTRSGVMPRWMSVITFVVALGFLLFAGRVRMARYIFPGWVFVVSVYILILNYRLESEARIQHHDPG